MASLAIAGCKGLTLGPTTQVEYVVVYPGDAAQVLENETVTVRNLKTGLVGKQNIGGWWVMPREHAEEMIGRYKIALPFLRAAGALK